MEQKEGIYFKNLDIVRFIAAIAVVFAHGYEAWKDYYVNFHYPAEEVPSVLGNYYEYYHRFFLNLGIGVEVFFFISGFLITYILLIEKERFGRISMIRFFIRRALRIWPLYFLLIALGPWLTNFVDLGNPDYISNIFFYSNFYVIYSHAWDYPFGHFWSIALEEQFYVVWPFIMKLYKKIKLWMVFSLLILISALSRAYFSSYEDEPYLYLYLNTLCRMDTLVIGGFIAYAFHKKKATISLPRFVPAILLVGLLTSFFFISYNEWGNVWSAVFKKYIYLAIFGSLIIDFVLNERFNGQNAIKRSLSYLGKISYGIYMFHNIMVIIVIKKILINNQIYSWTIFGITYVAVTILIAIISFEFYEKWFLRFKERFAMVKTRKF